MSSTRRTEEHKEMYLYHLYNNLGYEDLAISYNYYKEDQIMFSKWITYHELMHLHPEQHIPTILPFRMSREQFMTKATHRTILDVEILIDLDDLKIKGQTKFSTIKNKARWVSLELQKLKKNFVTYSTGSKGYHISFIEPRLRGYSYQKRKAVKDFWIKKFGGDLQKSSARCMIALEGERHHKSGKIKCEVNL